MSFGMDPVRQFFEDDQFARHCGIRIVSVGNGAAVAEMALGPQHLNGFQIPQGGAIFTLADHAFAAAANSHGRIAVAANVNISFLKAAAGGRLRAEAREVACSHRLGTYVVEVRDTQGELVAFFQGTAYRKSESIADWYERRKQTARR